MDSISKIDAMRTGFQGFVSAVTKYLETRKLTPVNESTTVPIETTVEYDLQTLVGVNFAGYDLKGASITFRFKDTDALSPTLDSYRSASSNVYTALRQDRYVQIVNKTGAVVEVFIKVEVSKLGNF
jgi:hypothetical protein